MKIKIKVDADYSKVEKEKCKCCGDFVCARCNKIYDLTILAKATEELVNR